MSQLERLPPFRNMTDLTAALDASKITLSRTDVKSVMAKPTEIVDADHFLTTISKFAGGHWMFRGVADEAYELVPKIGRSRSREKGYSRDKEIEIFERFKREASPFIHFLPKYESDYLVVAQHHGLPTRLLDWSESPLVAAFFAMSTNDGIASAVIYAIPKSFAPGISGTSEPFENGNIQVLYPPHHTSRITTQRGLFTLFGDPTKPIKGPIVRKLVFRQELRQSIMVLLDTLGINQSSIYPDMDGLAGYLGWRYRYDA